MKKDVSYISNKHATPERVILDILEMYEDLGDPKERLHAAINFYANLPKLDYLHREKGFFESLREYLGLD